MRFKFAAIQLFMYFHILSTCNTRDCMLRNELQRQWATHSSTFIKKIKEQTYRTLILTTISWHKTLQSVIKWTTTALIGDREREYRFFHFSPLQVLHLYSKIMLFSGAKPTQALRMFSSIARCFDSAFTTGVPGGTWIPRRNEVCLLIIHQVLWLI